MSSWRSRAISGAVALWLGMDAAAAASGPLPPGTAPYADLADMALAAPVVVSATVRATVRERRAADLPPGWRRYRMRAVVARALAAPGAVPRAIEYLWDVDSSSRPDTTGREVLLFLQPVAGRADGFRLAGPRAQLLATPALVARAEALVREARAPGAAGRRVAGVSRAFTTEGAVTGEHETQLFVDTAGGEPVSLVVVTRPGEAKRWSAALGDTIDEAAAPPARETLGWYWLACGLPRALPAAAVADLDAGARAQVAEDYAFVLSGLGPCGRTAADASTTPTAAQSG